VSPGIRSAVLGVAIAFCALFALLTISVALEDGFDVLTIISLLVIALIGSGLIGAIRNPPPE
jgi:hypothetical protein